MKLDLSLSESEEMLKNTALDFMRHNAPKEAVSYTHLTLPTKA